MVHVTAASKCLVSHKKKFKQSHHGIIKTLILHDLCNFQKSWNHEKKYEMWNSSMHLFYYNTVMYM